MGAFARTRKELRNYFLKKHFQQTTSIAFHPIKLKLLNYNYYFSFLRKSTQREAQFFGFHFLFPDFDIFPNLLNPFYQVNDI